MASETAVGEPAEREPAAGTSDGWHVYFGQPAPPAGGVNWDAYSHEELYQMLWQDADVADISTIAADWSSHRQALVNHAEVLREQRATLLATWEGTGAEQAAQRLATLADRVEKIAALAEAGENAAQQAAHALAQARSAMPAPAGAAAAPAADPAANWANVTSAPPVPQTNTVAPPAPPGGMFGTTPAPGADILAAQNAAPQQWLPQAPATTSTAPADSGGAFTATGGAGFSFYVGANATDVQKQQAVRAMQGYESSLTDSSQLIGRAQGTIPAAAPSMNATTASGAAASPATIASGAASSAVAEGPRSWSSLIGAGNGSGRGLAAGATVGTMLGGPGAAVGLGANALGQGRMMGAVMPGGPGMPAGRFGMDSAMGRSGAMGGMVPPGGGRGGNTADDEYESRLPTLDRKLFPSREPDSEAVIGLHSEDVR